MGYKIDLVLEDGSSGKEITKQLDEEYLQGKTMGEVIKYVLDTVQGKNNREIAEIMKNLYNSNDMDLYQNVGVDTRPVEIGDLVLKKVRTFEEAGEEKGKLHLIIQGSEVIG